MESLISLNQAPKVAYMTMAFNPMLYYRKVFSVLYQDYPNDRKSHLLIYQRSPITGKFPPPIESDMPFKIYQSNVEGEWPALYAFKLWKAIEILKSIGADICIFFDEDDEFPPSWTKDVIAPIMAGADGSWSWMNIDVQRGIVKGYSVGGYEYNSAIGTLAVKTDVLIKASNHLKQLYPYGRRKPDRGGALDNQLKHIILQFAPNGIIEHKGLRGYFRHSYTNTTKRKPELDIDYDFDYGKKAHRQPLKNLNRGAVLKKDGKVSRRKKI